MISRVLLVAVVLGLACGDVVVRNKGEKDSTVTVTQEATPVTVKRHNHKDSKVVRHRQIVTVGDEGSTTVSSADSELEDAELAEDLAILESILEESKTWDTEEDEAGPSSLAEAGMKSDTCGCFPGSAEVRLQDGSSTMVSALQQGDMVQTFLEDGSMSFSPFVLDFHTANKVKAEFVELSTDIGKPLRATANHLVYTSSGNFVRAAEVKVGDELLVFEADSETGKAAKVVNVRMVLDESIFSPLTDSGRLVVEGYAVSSYSLRSGEVSAMRAALGEKVDVHGVSHAMEQPVLALYRSGIPQVAASICNAVLGSTWCGMGPSPTDVAWTWNIRIVSDGFVPLLKRIL
jgi:hypothetical protein